jgi:hypothetical protein
MEPPDIYSFYEEGANGVSIKSSQGSSTGCVPSGLLRTTIFQVKCDKSIKDMAVIDSIETQGSSGCTYVVNMRSEYGCPIRPKVYTYFSFSALLGATFFLAILISFCVRISCNQFAAFTSIEVHHLPG